MQTQLHRPFWRSRWWMPAYSLALGVIAFAAFTIGGHVADGLVGFEIANGQDGDPYGLLCALGGIAYLIAVGVQRVRS
jgi:hypothetical protein